MSISIINNYELNASIFLDSRRSIASLNDLKRISQAQDILYPHGFEVFCVQEGSYYVNVSPQGEVPEWKLRLINDEEPSFVSTYSSQKISELLQKASEDDINIGINDNEPSPVRVYSSQKVEGVFAELRQETTRVDDELLDIDTRVDYLEGEIWKIYGFDGSYDSLTNKPTIPSIDGLATKEYVDSCINEALDGIGSGGSGDGNVSDGTNVDLTDLVVTNSISMGRKEDATIGERSVAVGNNVTASSYASHAEGIETIASNSCSHAEGAYTTASGMSSHAEGRDTEASGNYSHTEGESTTASGETSHAEGYETTASGDYSHAEGIYTTASGLYSHAEGYNTKASSSYSHAEGFYTTASGHSSHAEGRYTKASSENQHVQGKWNVEDTTKKYAHIVGNGTSNSARSNAHTLDWDGNAWYAGQVMATNLPWSTLEIGELIIEQTVLFDTQSNGIGIGFTDDIPLTFAEGEKICFTFDNEQYICETRRLDEDNIYIGNGTLDSYDEIHNNEPFGVNFSKYGDEYIVRIYTIEKYAGLEVPVKIEKVTGELHKLDEKYLPDIVYDKFATKEYVDSYVNEALDGIGSGDTSGDTSADVNLTDLVVTNSISMGRKEGTTIGEKSFAVGNKVEASGKNSHAEGGDTVASGESSHAEGWSTNASGYFSHAEGEEVEASGYASHAQGSGTHATGSYSHAEGRYSVAEESYSHAEGYNTRAKGLDSHAEGSNTTASGSNSHAEGYYTTASGHSSHAEGRYTIASSEYQHVQGKYNIEDTTNTYAHIVGNGDENVRSNAHTLDWDGNAWFAGEVYGTNIPYYREEVIVNMDYDDYDSIFKKTQPQNTQGYTSSSLSRSIGLVIGDEYIVEWDDKRFLVIATYNSNYDATQIEFTMDYGDNGKIIVEIVDYLNFARLYYETQNYVGKITNNLFVKRPITNRLDSELLPDNIATKEYVDGQMLTTIISKTDTLITPEVSTFAVNNGILYIFENIDGLLDYDRIFTPKITVNFTNSNNEAVEMNFNFGLKDDTSVLGHTVQVFSDDDEYYITLYFDNFTNINDFNNQVAFSLKDWNDDSYTINNIEWKDYIELKDIFATKEYVDDAVGNISVGNAIDTNDLVVTNSISMGRKIDTTIGTGSVALGNDVEASGDYSHAEGYNTTASKSYSHAEGYRTEVSGISSHAEGHETEVSGDYSHAEGGYTTASGFASHAEGYYTEASGDCSHAEGSDTIASSNYQHVQGKYNIEDSAEKYAHIVGNGDEDTRSNAHTLDWDGNAWFAGNVKVGADNKVLATEEYVDNAIDNIPEGFSGNYNDLTNKPTIPSIEGLATEGYVNNMLSGLRLIQMTQSEYDALEVKDSNTLYIII